MKSLFLLLAFFTLPLNAAPANKTEVQVRQISDNEYELILTSNETTDVAAAQNALIPGAEDLCKNKNVLFGKYKFETSEPIKSADHSEKTLILTQNISCRSDALAKSNKENTSEIKWEPSEQDQLKIKLLSYQYIQAKDKGDFKTAFEAFSETTSLAIDYNNWKYNQLIFNATAGELIDSTFTRVTWYDNPHEAPVSGIFAAVDYSNLFTNIEINCGYLIWHKKNDGSFELIREETNYINKETQKKLSANEIEQTKTEFGCRK